MTANPNAITVALTLFAATPVIGDTPAPVVVTFVKQGSTIVLAEEERSRVAERVRALVVGCGITSVSSPAMFAGRALADEWQELRARSHVYVRFPQPLQAQRGSLQILEVAIGVEDANFIGPELTRYHDQVVAHVKCDGHRALALMCGTALRAHLLAGQKANCSVYDRIGDPR